MLKLEQIGRIGKIDDKGKLILLSIATNQRYKNGDEWEDRTVWKTHKTFSEWTANKIRRFNKGDLVYIQSKEAYNEYENDEGETRKTTQYIITDIERLKKKNTENTNENKDGLPF